MSYRFLTLLAVLALVPVAARADCPLPSQIRTCKTPSNLVYQDSTASFTDPAVRDSAFACFTCTLPGVQCEGFVNGPTQVVQVDIPAGIVYARFSGNGSPGRAPLGAISQDQYSIIGPPTSAPIPCTASFYVGGYGSCRSAGSLSMTVQSQTLWAAYDNGIHQGPCNTPPAISGALALPVTAAPGETFVVTLSAQITDPPVFGGNAYLYGRLVFRDLPAGYAVISCKGYGAAATPAGGHSWGSVKALYR
jgi:hypothetical protein